MSNGSNEQSPEPEHPWHIRYTLCLKLAEALGETRSHARWLLRKIIDDLGSPACVDLLRETLHIEQQGGMLTRDDARKRTRGGIFFALCKQRLTEEQRARLFPTPADKRKRKRKAGPAIAAGSTPTGDKGARP